MRVSGNLPTFCIPGVVAVGALAAGFVTLPGCLSGPGPRCHVASGIAQSRDGYYSVVLVLENNSERVLDLEDVVFEVTTYDARGKVIQSGARSKLVGADIKPWDNTRVHLSVPDQEGEGRRSEIVLRDREGNVLSRYRIDAPEGSG